ncbi:MAG TPA: tail fiber domain-containing protein [Candidatus Kapabacteria bacterium]|nr:tail fiber domain-containing protein [Candidatus Kapabacteria bacterium]
MSTPFLHRPLAALALIALVLAGSALPMRLAAQTAPPRLLSYQGVLSDDTRTAVPDGSYPITFRIYAQPTGGAVLWEEKTTVATIDGVFETVLGATTPITLAFDVPYWLAIELAGDAEMTPRVQLVSAPYAIRSLTADTAMQLDAGATGVVRSVNLLDGDVVVAAEGIASVRMAGDTISIVVPQMLPLNPSDGQHIRWNATTGAWEAIDPRADTSVTTTARLTGRGTASAPLDIAQMGATNGQPLVWDETSRAWRPGESGVQSIAPITGTGSTASPLKLEEGTSDRQALVWSATERRWVAAEQSVRSSNEITGDGTAATPLRLAAQGAMGGQVLRWDATVGGWRPGAPITAVTAPLRGGGIAGDPLMMEPGTRSGQLLHWNGVQWTALPTRLPVDGEVLRWNGSTGSWEPAGIVVTGAVPLSAGAIWYGGATNTATELPAGGAGQVLAMNGAGTRPQWTSTLAVDSIGARTVTTSGDVRVGGSLTVGGPAVDLPAGSIGNAELANPAVAVRYGAGIAGDTVVALGDTLDLGNTGVLSITGTTNQVIASAATGAVTLSLPQDIHTDARPTFDGVTLDNLVTTSVSDTVLTMSAGAVQARSVASLVGTIGQLVWTTTGNAGTNPATNFLGTIDNQSLDIRVNNERVMRYSPEASPNIIGGYMTNSIAAGVHGATIAGGGTSVSPNSIATGSLTAVISGGAGNAIGSSAVRATIGGGINNTIGNGSYQSTISGGAVNQVAAGSRDVVIAGGGINWVGANSAWGVISGGYRNYIRDNAANSTIGGGIQDTIYDNAGTSTIAGGTFNAIGTSSGTSTIGGGNSNKILASSSTSVIAGGASNTTASTTTVIGGGDINDIGTNSRWSQIAGGHNNNILNDSYESTIGAGEGNDIGPSAVRGTIGGGSFNDILQSSSNSTIAGGYGNQIAIAADRSTIGGGMSNRIAQSASVAVVAGGTNNIVDTSAWGSTIGGGQNNVIDNGSSISVIDGGDGNRIGTSSSGAVIAGGQTNAIGNNARMSAIAGGRGLTLDGRGSFGFLGGNDNGSRAMSIADIDVAVLGNTNLWLANNDNSASQLRFFEANATVGAFPGTTNHSSFEAQSQVADIRYILPDTAGIVGDLLAVRTVSGTSVTLDWAASATTPTWSLTGNAGTTPGTHFIGTTDAQAFEIHVDESGVATGGRRRVMRYEPNATSANILGGHWANALAGGVVGTTIAGGGGNGTPNTISSDWGTISGGKSNAIGTTSINGTISGGVSNQITGAAGNATVSGGMGNVITSGDHTTISGGFNNRIQTGSFGSTLGGGTNNATASHTTIIAGGNGGSIGTGAQFSTIGGGHLNAIGNGAFGSTIVGGVSNAIGTNASYSTIAGGHGLTLTGSGSLGFLGNNTGANAMSVATANVTVLGNTDLWLANNDNAASALRLYEPNATAGAFPGATNYSSLASQAQAADIDYLLPAAAGVMGDQLTITAVAGSTVTLGWAAASDRRIKSDIVTLDGERFLSGLRAIPLGSWRYTTDPSGRRHYGIMAQDFKTFFGNDGLGEIGTDSTVNDLDLIGVSYLSIQALEKRTASDRTDIEELRSVVNALKEQLEELRRENAELRERLD